MRTEYKIIAESDAKTKTLKTEYVANSFEEAVAGFLRQNKELDFKHIYIAKTRVEK